MRALLSFAIVAVVVLILAACAVVYVGGDANVTVTTRDDVKIDAKDTTLDFDLGLF